jgi:hypothetical protein
MTNTVIKVPATPAVMEFQILNSKIANRLAGTNQSSGVAYWLQEMDTRTKTIAEAHGLTVEALITEWESWYALVEIARAKVTLQISDKTGNVSVNSTTMRGN